MTADLTSTVPPDVVATLTRAATAFQDSTRVRPSALEVVNALLQAEKAVKQQRLAYPLESLLDDWRLCFTAPGKAHLQGSVAVGKGFYVPQIARAQISFTVPPTSNHSLDKAEISNSFQFGLLLFKLIGSARYLGKKNIMAFDFNYMQLSLFGRSVYSGEFRGGKATATNFEHQSLAKLPFFTFFLVTSKFIAARGRGGGLALWVKEA